MLEIRDWGSALTLIFGIGGIVQVRDILHKHRERGALIIIACHDSEELNYLSDETIVIEDGKIVDKTMNYS